MLDVLFTFLFIALFTFAGWKIFSDDDDHDEWRGY